MTRDAPRSLDWPAIIATAFCMAFLGVLGLFFSTFAPKQATEAERAAMRARSLPHCGAGMFDVVPHDQSCPRYDAIALVAPTGTSLTLRDDGRALLVVTAPGKDDALAKTRRETLAPGRYEASVDGATFREFSNFVASLELDRRGSVQLPPDAHEYLLRAGCEGRWTVEANYGSGAREVPAVSACLQDFQRRADWSLVTATPVVPATK